MIMRFDVVIMEDEEVGGYVGIVPSLPGCQSQGETIDELMKNIKEAIELYLETLDKDEKEELLSEKMEFAGIQRVEVETNLNLKQI